MTKTCVVCKKYPISGDNSRSFHKFPHNEEMKKQWMIATGISKVTVNCTVCSDHFTPQSYHSLVDGSVVKRLLRTAVPIVKRHDDDDNTLHSILGNLESGNVAETQSKTRTRASSKREERNVRNGSEFSENQSISNDSSKILPEGEVILDMDYRLKRKLSSCDIIGEGIKKMFRFRDGDATKYISREEFVTEEAWEKFLRLMYLNRRRMEGLRQRLSKKMLNYQKIIEGKQIEEEKEEDVCSPERFLEVVLKE